MIRENPCRHPNNQPVIGPHKMSLIPGGNICEEILKCVLNQNSSAGV